MLRICYEYVPRQSCIAAEQTKNCRFSRQTQRHSLPQKASLAQLWRQFVPQVFFRKLSNIMFVATAAAVPQNTFDNLYRPLGTQLLHADTFVDMLSGGHTTLHPIGSVQYNGLHSCSSVFAALDEKDNFCVNKGSLLMATLVQKLPTNKARYT